MVAVKANSGAQLSEASCKAVMAGNAHSIVERIAELEAALRELIAATNEFVGWHRTDKIVVRDVERIDDWRKAREAAKAVLASDK
jgi:hypothetical protein